MFKHQAEAVEFGLNNPKWLLLDAPGLGKALPLDTPVLTPNGFKPIDAIHAGDIVFDDKGNPCKVIEEFYHESLDMYKLDFTTKDSIICCKDHLW